MAMIGARKLKGWLNLALGGLLMLAVWVLLVFAASRPALRQLYDLSPRSVFTVSPATEELMREIRAEELRVEFHTFFAPLGSPPRGNELARQQWTIYSDLQRYTYDLLRKYAILGGAAVLLKHHDVQNEIQETQEYAQRFNVEYYQTVVVVVGDRHKKLTLEGDMAVVDYPSAGPGGAAPGQSRGVPLLKDYKGEEALSSAIKGLLVEGEPVAYFLTGYRERKRGGQHATVGAGYSRFDAALRAEGFRTEELALSETGAVPDDAAVVALLEPQVDITERDARVLADYVRSGGRLFINFSFTNLPGMNPTFTALGELLGFDVSREGVFHLIRNTNNPQAPGLDGDPGVGRVHVFQANPNHPITRPLVAGNRGLQLEGCRELSKRQDAPDDVRPDPSLLVSGRYAWLVTPGPAGQLSYQMPRTRESFRPRSLGMVIDVDAGAEGEIGHVVLLGGYSFNNAGFNFHRDLGLNIFNWLAERKALVTVRGRQYQAQHIQLVPQQLDNIAWLLVAGVPGALLLLGFLVFWRRSRI